MKPINSTTNLLPTFFNGTVWYALVTSLLLVFPYATGGMTFYMAEGRLTIQPRVYLVLVAGLVAVNAVLSRPKISKGLVCLLALLALRLADALFLDRLPTTTDVDPRSFSAGAFVYALALSSLLGNSTRLRIVAYTNAIVVLVTCCLLNAWEWNYPGAFSTVEGRSAGWLQNANDSAAAIVCMLALILALRPVRWLAVFSIAIAGVGVYFTLSRSGAIVWVAVVVVFFAINLRKGGLGFLYVCGLGALAAVLILKMVDFGTVLSGDRNVLNRQDQLVGRGVVDINDTSRLDLLLEGLEGISAKPLTGYGSYSSYDLPFKPHNMVVAAWLDSGVVGFVLLTAGIVLTLRSVIQRERDLLIACVPLVLLLPFSHNLLENKSYLVVWIVVSGLVAQKSRLAFPQRVPSRPRARLGRYPELSQAH